MCWWQRKCYCRSLGQIYLLVAATNAGGANPAVDCISNRPVVAGDDGLCRIKSSSSNRGISSNRFIWSKSVINFSFFCRIRCSNRICSSCSSSSCSACSTICSCNSSSAWWCYYWIRSIMNIRVFCLWRSLATLFSHGISRWIGRLHVDVLQVRSNDAAFRWIPDLLLRHNSIDLCEYVLECSFDVCRIQGRRFDEAEPVTLSKALRFVRGHGTQMPQVALVADEHDNNVLIPRP